MLGPGPGYFGLRRSATCCAALNGFAPQRPSKALDPPKQRFPFNGDLHCHMRLSTTIAVIILTCAFIYALFAVYVLQHITDGQKCPTWAAKAPCSNHGSCATSGNCQCEPGYGGMDCSIAHSAVVGLLVDRHFDQPDAPQIHKAFAELPQMGFLSPWHEHVIVVRQDEYADSEGGRRISGIKNTVGIRDILPNQYACVRSCMCARLRARLACGTRRARASELVYVPLCIVCLRVRAHRACNLHICA